MDLRTKILVFIYKLLPFDLKGDARFTDNRDNFRLSCIINFYKRTDLLRNILTFLCEHDFDNNEK